MFGLLKILAIAATLEQSTSFDACSSAESTPNDEPPVIGQTDYG